MQEVKNQHYVPQMYLEKFTHNGTNLFVFDKFKQKTYETNKKNIASQTHFYDFPESDENHFQDDADVQINLNGLNRTLDKQTVEKVLSTIEGQYKQILDSMLESISMRGEIDYEQKLITSHFMTLQILRTPEFRRSSISLAETLLEEVVFSDFRLRENNLRIKFNEEHHSIEHALFMFDTKIQERLVNTLCKHIWFIGINNTPQPLFTSDTPIVKSTRHQNSAIGYNEGYGSPSIEIIYPLTPKYAIILRDKQIAQPLEAQEYHTYALSVSDVNHFNYLQVVQSYRQIYSSANMFELAKRTCHLHPEICIPDWKRQEVREINIDTERTIYHVNPNPIKRNRKAKYEVH